MPGWCRETEVYQLIHGWSISCDNKPKERRKKQKGNDQKGASKQAPAEDRERIEKKCVSKAFHVQNPKGIEFSSLRKRGWDE
jgi:hypothetical protein